MLAYNAFTMRKAVYAYITNPCLLGVGGLRRGAFLGIVFTKEGIQVRLSHGNMEMVAKSLCSKISGSNHASFLVSSDGQDLVWLCPALHCAFEFSYIICILYMSSGLLSPSLSLSLFELGQPQEEPNDGL